MKHTINLYPSELRPRVELLTVHTVFIAMVFTAVCAWGVNNWFVANNEELMVDLNTLNNEISRKTSVLAIIHAELENRAEDPRLVDISTIKERELREKLFLIDALNQRDTLKTKSFAQLLHSLAVTANQDVWLTGIHVVNNDLVLHGMSQTPEAVPRWIASLSDHEYFTGKQFASAQMSRAEDHVRFVLRTNDSNTDAGGE